MPEFLFRRYRVFPYNLMVTAETEEEALDEADNAYDHQWEQVFLGDDDSDEHGDWLDECVYSDCNGGYLMRMNPLVQCVASDNEEE